MQSTLAVSSLVQSIFNLYCSVLTQRLNGVCCDTILALVVQVCTFSSNRAQILRCAICDAVRGTSWEYYKITQAQSSPAERPATDTREARGLAAPPKGDQ